MGGLALEMSASSLHAAGSDHTGPAVDAVTVPRGGTLCQPAPRLAADARWVQLGVFAHGGGTLPTLRLRFVAADGMAVALGRLAAGARAGRVRIALQRMLLRRRAVSACVHGGRSRAVGLAGERGGVGWGSARVDGRAQAARVSLVYLRAKPESWWGFLPRLDRRFAFGKSSLFGPWALPAVALVLLGVWISAATLLARQLR